MAIDIQRRKLLIMILLGTMLPLVTGILFLVAGITVYRAQSLQKSQYRKSTCEILTAQYESKTCTKLWQQGKCYVPVWQVRHSGPKFINANMESENTYETMDRASLEVDDYEVAIFSW